MTRRLEMRTFMLITLKLQFFSNLPKRASGSLKSEKNYGRIEVEDVLASIIQVAGFVRSKVSQVPELGTLNSKL